MAEPVEATNVPEDCVAAVTKPEAEVDTPVAVPAELADTDEAVNAGSSLDPDPL